MSKPATIERGKTEVAGGKSSRRFTFTHLAVVLVLLVAGAYLFIDLYRSQLVSREGYASALHGMEVIGELQFQMQEARRTLLYSLGTGDANLQVKYADDSRVADQQVGHLLKKEAALLGAAARAAARTKLAADWSAYLKVRDALIITILQGDARAAIERDQREGIPAFNQVQSDLIAMKQYFNADAERLLRQVDAMANLSLLRLIVMLTITLFAARLALKFVQRDATLRAVQSSEARLRRDLESISEELFALDADGRLVTWNRVAEQHWQRERGQVVGRRLSEALPELAASPLREAIDQALKLGQSAALENLLIRRAEKTCHYRARVLPIQGGVSVFLDDVTAQCQAEVVRARLATILEGTPDFVSSTDSHGRVLYVNRAGRRMMGIADDEDITQLTITDFHPEWAGELIRTNGMPVAIRDGFWSGETALLTRNGVEMPLSQVILTHKTAEGSIDYFSVIGRDVTDAKRAETELLDSWQKFETLVNSVEGVVWEADFITNSFVFVSQRAKSLFGFPCARWTQDPGFWSERLHPEDRDWAEQYCRSQAAKCEKFSFEYRMIAADGRTVWIRDYVNVVKDGDRPALLRGILIDITSQKEAEDKLASVNEQLIETSRKIGMAEVATGVLHNVGNVLNSVNVSTTLIREQLSRSEVTSLVKLAEILRKHSANLDSYLTKDSKGKLVPGFVIQLADHLAEEHALLEKEHEQLAKSVEHVKEIVARQQSYANVSGALESVRITNLVEDALQMNSAGLLRHGIRVVRSYEDEPAVLVDKHKALQILVNLLQNAKNALDDSGRADKLITVEVRMNGNNRVKVAVTDNGVGIPPENLTRLFAHGFTTRRGGHGFGLHSGANAAKEMGGELKVCSEGLGKGAAFTLELPLDNGKQTI